MSMQQIYSPVSSLSSTFAPVATATLRPGRRWMFMGDSITNGSSAGNFAYSYARQSLDMVGTLRAAVDSWEAGEPGYTSAQLLAWSPTLLALRPGAVHVQIGTNDVGQSVPLATFQSNIAAIVARIKANGVPVTIGTVPPRSASVATTTTRALTSSYNMWIRMWAPTQGVEVADVYGALVDPATGDLLAANDSGDGIHPGRAGHYKMAQAVAGAMIRTYSTSTPTQTYSIGDGNLYGNPLMNGTVNPTGTFAAGNNTGTAATYSCIADTSGALWAGQWSQIDLDSATTSRAGRDSTISSGWATGEALALAGLIQVEDVTGSGAWQAAVAAGTASVNVQLVNQSGSVFASVLDYCPGRIVSTGVHQVGPFWKTVVIPGGTTGVTMRYGVACPSGLRVKARFGALGIINLTTLGLAVDGSDMVTLSA